MLAAFRQQRRVPFIQVLKSAIATVAAWLVAEWLLPGAPPLFAAIAAILVVAPSVNQSLAKGVERSVGVLIGVTVASALGVWLGTASWVVILAIVAGAFVAWLAKVTPGTANQVAISAMLVLVLGQPNGLYALERIIETLLGAAIGLIVNALIVPPVLIEPSRRALALLGGELAAALSRLADALEGRRTPAELYELLLQARLLVPMREHAAAAIAACEESLTMNPRRNAHRADIAAQRALLEQMVPTVTQAIAMTRAVCDLHTPSLAAEPAVPDIAEQLRRAAHDVRLTVHLAEVEPEPITSVIRALTAPLQVAPPTSENWVLIGFLTEDLRRIHDQYTRSAP